MQTPITSALDSLNVPYRTFTHSGPIASLEQAAEERGQRPNQVVRSIVFRVGKDEFVMVLANGARQISWPALRKYIGQSRLTTATEAELLEATGYTHGAVAPYGLPRPMRILADEAIFEEEEISIGSGVRGTTVILRSADLKASITGLEVGVFANAT
jgi:Cys-tRNA(Pro)/Cys-tRNA(Cys) deacylase